MIHVTLPQLCAFLDDELAESSAELVRRHLSECLECTERFAWLEAQEESLVRILCDEPDEEFFQQLCASISLGQPDPAERRVPVPEEKPVSKKDAKRKAKRNAAPEPSKKSAPERREAAAAPSWAEPLAHARNVAAPRAEAVPAASAEEDRPAPVHAEPVKPVQAATVAPIDEKPATPAREEHVTGRAERLMREEPTVVRTEWPARGTPLPVRPVRRSMVRPQRRAGDPSPHALSPRAAAIVAVICCLVAGSIAWVTLRPRGGASTSTATSPKVESTTTAANPAKASTPTPEELLDRSAPPPPAEKPQESPTPQVTKSNDSAPEPEPIEAQAPEPAWRDNIAPTPAATPPPPPERLVERAPSNFVPVRTVISETVVAPAAEPDAPAPASPSNALTKPDPAAAAMRDAKSASLEAAKSKTPAAFDRSSEGWERAIPLLENAPEQLAIARREWAQARFQAWAAEPNAVRRDAAIAATRQYLLYAPPGPERDQAWTWLGRLKH